MQIRKLLKYLVASGMVGFLLAQSLALYGQPFEFVPASFTFTGRSVVSWCDFDNDGDLDFIIAGLNTADVPLTRLYRNQSGSNVFSANTPPVPPDDLSAFVVDNSVFLSWSAGWDDQTPAAGLSYNVMVGTETGMVIKHQK
ncbi:MAG: hypothetical protein K0B08_01650 [Bacteroidales bacterium]|nr:hypothetical protein [Bacteroidales bacterium]